MEQIAGVKLGICIKVDRISSDGNWIRLAKDQDKQVIINAYKKEYENYFYWIKIEILEDSELFENLDVEDPDECPLKK